MKDLFFLVSSIVTLVHLCRYSARFPYLYLVIIIAALLSATLGALWENARLGQSFDTWNYINLVWAPMDCFVWAPYFFYSKRARNTFGVNLNTLKATFD